MPKLSRFQKALKLDKEAGKHAWRNYPTNHKADDVAVWESEKYYEGKRNYHRKIGNKQLRNPR